MLDELFRHPAADMHTIMGPDTFSDWLSLVKSKDFNAFENHGAIWFRIFSEQVKAKGLIDDEATTERFYYPSGGTYMRNAHHNALRKCDIVLIRKLDSQNHGLASNINITPDSNASGGDETGGDALGDDVLGGGELGGDALGGDKLSGDEPGGDELSGDALGGGELSGNARGDDELGGDALDGDGLGSGNILEHDVPGDPVMSLEVNTPVMMCP